MSVREKFEDELTELQEKMMSLVQFTDCALTKEIEAIVFIDNVDTNDITPTNKKILFINIK